MFSDSVHHLLRRLPPAVPPDSFWNGFDQGYPAGGLVSATEHGGFYTAIAKGYYKEEGLDVSIRPGGPFAFAAKQVAAGAAEFGMGSSDALSNQLFVFFFLLLQSSSSTYFKDAHC